MSIRIVVMTLLALFAASSVLCFTKLAYSSSAGELPQGLYFYSYPHFIKSGESEKALKVKGIKGAAVVMNWAELEPANGSYGFEEFDRRMGLVRSHGLAIELGILAGGGAPAWIYAPPPIGRDARRLDFVFSHHHGKGRCINVTLAPPWDPNYQAAFAKMLDHLAAHLRTTGALQDVKVVKLTGVNTDTDEVRLPAETPQETGNPCVTDAIAAWRSVGYRPSLVAAAMRAVATSWDRAFPDAWKVFPLIPRQSLPPVGEEGHARTGRSANSLVHYQLGNIIAEAESILRGHFIIQMDWLMADKPVRPQVMEFARRFSTPVAWQTNFYLGREGKGAACGGQFGKAVRCDNASFLRLLRSGIYPEGGSGPNARGSFIEVFPPDVIEFSEVIAQAHDEMGRWDSLTR